MAVVAALIWLPHCPQMSRALWGGEVLCAEGPLLQVALVFPNNDPAASMVAFYGCLLAEVVPVPIEVPLTRKVRTPPGP